MTTDEVVRLLGEGTFGKVVECLDKTNETLVAVKIIRAIPKYRSAALVELDVLRTIRRHDPDGKRYVAEVFIARFCYLLLAAH